MRVQLYLTPQGEGGSTSHDAIAGSSSSSIPQPLTALTPSGELILIELQGSLEMGNESGDDSESTGQVVGEFQWGDGREDKPTLLLSHHKLEGKLVNLTKPLAVLRKRKRGMREQGQEDEQEDDDGGDDGGDETIRPPPNVDDDEDDHIPPSSPTSATTPPSSHKVSMKALADSDDDTDTAGDVSPSVRAGKKKRAVGDAETTHATPTKRPRVDTSSPSPSPSPSASPSSPLAPMRGSAIDFSSPPPRETGMTSTTRTTRTQVSYDVVCVIRKKVLFSKRPEPVVHRRA